MKKLILSLMFVFSFSTVFAAINKNLVENSDGTVSITNVDKDGSAIKFNKTVDNFQNVTVIDAKKVKNQKFIKASLEDFDKKEVMISFSCDVKVEDSTGAENEISWIIDEVSANFPVVSRQVLKSGEWTTMKGEAILVLGEKKSFYISAAGLNKENLKIYLKNFNLKIMGEGIGAPAPKVSWMDAPSLKDAYKDLFDYFGIAVSLKGELNTSDGQIGLERQASSITMGNEMKPDFLFAWKRPNTMCDFVAEDGNTYQVPDNLPIFSDVRMILLMARSLGIQMRGHVLVWHSQTPKWFFKENYSTDANAAYVDKATMTARQEWYIKSVLDYVRTWEEENNGGKRIITTWDVVNEAVADNAGGKKWLREDSDWFRIYKSEEFILNAFRFANKYAPADVQLAYNDYNCYAPNKRDAIANLIDLIKATPGARIDVLGMQSHVKINYPRIRGDNSFEAAVHKYLSKGVDVQITELDIANAKQPYSPYKLKNVYKEYFKMFIENRKVDGKNGISGVTIWGISDRGTWLNSQQEYKGYQQYPLLWDNEFNCKPAFDGVLEAALEAKEQ